MYVCYADESGHCGIAYNPRQPIEVVVGVVTDLTKLHKTHREHAQIIELLKKEGIPLSELKAADVYRGRNEWRGVSPKDRTRVFDLLLDWASERSCRIVTCPIDSKAFFERKADGCENSTRLGFPYEAGAMNILLAIQRNHAAKLSNKGKTFVIFDEQQEHNENLLELLAGDLAFTDEYTKYAAKRNGPPRLDQIVDVPHFSKSHLSVLIQLADCVAFVVNCYLLLAVCGHKEKYNGELKVITDWYSRIGEAAVPAAAIDPPGKEGLCGYYKEIRPSGWSASRWFV
jgi:hypothetical protein